MTINEPLTEMSELPTHTFGPIPAKVASVQLARGRLQTLRFKGQVTLKTLPKQLYSNFMHIREPLQVDSEEHRLYMGRRYTKKSKNRTHMY